MAWIAARPDRLKVFERIIPPFGLAVAVLSVIFSERPIVTTVLVIDYVVFNFGASALRYRLGPEWTRWIEIGRAVANSFLMAAILFFEGPTNPAFLFLVPGVVWAALAVQPRPLGYLLIVWYLVSYATVSVVFHRPLEGLILPLLTLSFFAGFSSAVVITMEGIVSDSLGLVLDSIPYTIFTTDSAGTINYLNRPAFPGRNGRIGGSYLSFVPPEDHLRIRGIVERARAECRSAEYEIQVSTNGQPSWLLVHVAPIQVAGKVNGLVFSVVDISARKSAEIAITKSLDEAAAATRAKSEFLAVVNHELRTPLNAILTGLEILSRVRTTMGDEDRRIFEMVETAGLHLRDQIKSLMDMSRSLRGRVEVSHVSFPIRDMIHEQIEMHRTGLPSDVEMKARIPEDFPSHVLGDPDRDSLIVQNLLHNASKHTKAGTITIRLEWMPDGKDRLKTSVSDTGSGIAPEHLSRLFQPFYQVQSVYTRTSGGMGLGLSLVKHNADVLGGSVSVESEPGRGTTFTVELPFEACPVWTAEGRVGMYCSRCINRPPGLRPPGWEERFDDLRGLRLFLVEDNEVNRFLLEKRLEQVGFRNILAAENGRRAIDAVLSTHVDVVLLDMHLPDMDGIAVASELRHRGYAGALIAVTADTSDATRARIHDAQIDGFVPKPVEMDAIIQAVLAFREGRGRP